MKKPDITREPFPTTEEIIAWERYKTFRLARLSLVVSIIALLKVLFT